MGFFFVFSFQLKGCSNGQVQKEVPEMIEVLGLQSKANSLSKTLSGGQKRKLSVGIALIGGTKVNDSESNVKCNSIHPQGL